MPAKSILALDIARTTGWAFNDGAGGLVSSVMSFGKIPAPQLLYEFHRWLLSKLHQYTPDVIVYEQPHLRGQNTFYLVAMGGLVQLLSYETGAPAPRAVHSSSIKTHALGKGKVKQELMRTALRELVDEGLSPSRVKTEHPKRAMLNAARRIWPKVRDDNEADALFLQSMVYEEIKNTQ